MSDSYEVDLSGLDFVVGMMREAPERISYEKLRAELDEANAALGAKNARIHEYAERHLADSAELEKLDKQLDEARELLERTTLYIPAQVPALHCVYAWLERNKP